MSDTLPQATRSTVSNLLSARSPLLREQAYTLALEIHILPLKVEYFASLCSCIQLQWKSQVQTPYRPPLCFKPNRCLEILSVRFLLHKSSRPLYTQFLETNSLQPGQTSLHPKGIYLHD